MVKSVTVELNGSRVYISGNLTTATLSVAYERVRGFLRSQADISSIDISAVSFFDSAGAIALLEIKKEYPKIKIFGIDSQKRDVFRLVLKRVDKNWQEPMGTPKKIGFEDEFVESIGAKFVDFLWYANFLGWLISSFTALFSKKNFKFAEIARQIEESSVKALPIVALSSFLIGVVVTYQGSLQLEKFGASIFAVDLLGISITRELAPLLTAVVIAGRSGAGFTSQIGVMKITEEIDAMKTMGLNPIYFLVWPRILALTVSLWLVILFADFMALVGGMITANGSLDIGYLQFWQRLEGSLAFKHIAVGLIKAPFFAFLIASIGVFRGLQVQKNSQSIGEMTTHSVVNSIFAVIICDAVFAILFTRYGI